MELASSETLSSQLVRKTELSPEMMSANAGELELKRQRGRLRDCRMACRSHELVAEIRALSSRIKSHVDELNSGKAENDPEVIKLGRQERNYNAVASSLAKAIEDSDVQITLSERNEEKKACVEARYNTLEAQQPTVVSRRVDDPRRRRTASEVCEAAYRIPEPSHEAAKTHMPDKDNREISSATEQTFRPNMSKKDEALRSRAKKGPIKERPSLHHEQDDLAPATIAAVIEPQEGLFEPRIQMPAFVINPNRNSKEAGGPWLHYKERDFGATCRKVFGHPPHKGEPTIEPVLLRKHEWKISMVADLHTIPGYASEGGTGSEIAAETPPESLVEGVEFLHETSEDHKDGVQKTEPDNGGEPEEYISEPATSAKIEKSQVKAKPSLKKAAFNWKAFHVKTESPSSSLIPAPVPVLFTGDVVPSGNNSKQHSVKEANVEDDAVEEADTERQDSPMEKKEVERPPLAQALDKMFSMDQMLPKRGANTRGRFFNPNDPRRDNLDVTTLDTFGGCRVPNRRRSPTSEQRDKDDHMISHDYTELPGFPMEPVDIEHAVPRTGEETFSGNEMRPTHRTSQRGRFFEPRDPRRNDLRRSSLKNFRNLKRPRSLSSDSIHSKQKAVCKNCWQRYEFCTSKGQCKKCMQSGRDCVYVNCQYGLGCRKRTCACLHPGQFEEGSGEWNVVTGNLGRKNSLH